MDNHNQTLIVDISSSDDDIPGGFEEDSSTADNFDWISKLLEPSPPSPVDLGFLNTVNDVDDDDDDVVVVGEVMVSNKPIRPNRPKLDDANDDDDDDCVVLDGDPDKPVPMTKTAIKDVKGGGSLDDGGGGGDDEELLIVSEKGQVACRDYPHSRHLCAKLTFSSTAHESHCDLCHCYVCDTLAPCAFWNSGGVSGIGHCHATDKQQFWQVERKKFRQSKNPPVPVTRPPISTAVTKLRQLQQNSALRPASTCGLPSSCSRPNIIRLGSPRANVSAPRNRFHSHLVPQQLPRTCNSNTQSSRVSTSSPNLGSSRPMFKRSVAVRGTPPNRSAGYGPPTSTKVSQLHQLLSHPVLAKSLEDYTPINLAVSRQQAASCVSTGGLPLQFQGYSHSSVHTPTSHFQGYGMPAAVTSDSPYVYTSGSQTLYGSSPVVPSDASYALKSSTQSIEQPSAVTQEFSTLISPCGTFNTPQSSEGTHEIPTSSIPCNNSTSLNNVAQSCQQPSLEQNLSDLDFDFERWLSDNEPLQEGSGLSVMNNQHSEPPSVDAGMLYFDFETSWKGLTHS